MIRLPTQKLSAGDNSYIRPVKTITESLSKEDIEEQLEGYVEIEGDDLNFININTSLKYLSYDKINKSELLKSQLEDTADIVQKQTDIITKQKLELLALKKKLKNMSS